MMIKYIVLTFLLFINCISHLSAQSYKLYVSGIVTDAQSKEPMPGVEVIIKGTSTGTLTQINGSYTIEVNSDSDYLVFSYLGYASQVILVEGRSQINVEM